MNEKTKLIRCGRLIDGTGNPPVENASILIEGSKIKAVGIDIRTPDEARIIDATGMTVMPGLIDSQVHHSGGFTNDFAMEWVTRPSELRLIKSVFDSRAFLASGFTTVKDCGSTNAIFLKKSAAEGTLTGVPRVVAAGYVLTQTFGHLDSHYLPPDCVDARTSQHGGRLEALICDGVPECIKAARYALRFGADFIMICASGGVMSERDLPSDVQFHPDEIQAIVDTAAQVGKYVAAHSLNSRGTKNCIRAGVKTIIHSFRIDDEVIALGKEHGTIFTSSLAVARNLRVEASRTPWATGKAEGIFEQSIDTYTRIRKAGAILAVGLVFAGAQELELLVKYCGFTPMETILAATKHGAVACFMGDKTGTLEPGKLADVIIVDGNPLEDIRILQDMENIRLVMLEGKIEVDRGI